MQWVQTEIQKILFKIIKIFYKKNKNSWEGDQTLGQVTLKGCGVSVWGDIQNPTSQGPDQQAVADHALSGMVGQDDLQRCLQPHMFPDSVLLY